jgi:hypothetical protein
MSMICTSCSKNTAGWAHVSNYRDSFTYCSYDCYKHKPCLIPTPSIPMATDSYMSTNKVILPIRKQIVISPFIFLTDTEINDLSSTEYIKYNEDVDDQFLLNPIRSEVHYTNIENDKHVKSIEDKFTCHSDTESDDY